MGCLSEVEAETWVGRVADQETISANACGEEGRGRDEDRERGGEANGREIEKGWNDREPERKDKEGCRRTTILWSFSLSRKDPQDDAENAIRSQRPFWAFIKVGCEEWLENRKREEGRFLAVHILGPGVGVGVGHVLYAVQRGQKTASKAAENSGQSPGNLHCAVRTQQPHSRSTQSPVTP